MQLWACSQALSSSSSSSQDLAPAGPGVPAYPGVPADPADPADPGVPGAPFLRYLPQDPVLPEDATVLQAVLQSESALAKAVQVRHTQVWGPVPALALLLLHSQG